MPSICSEFRDLLLSLREYFAAETAAVSVVTEKFGTIARGEVDSLLGMMEAR